MTAPRRRPLGRPAAVALIALAALAACSEPIPKDATAAQRPLPEESECTPADAIVDCAPAGTMLEPYFPDRPTRATGTPIKIGTINQDTGAAGAFPELTQADRTAFDFINEEMNGVDGHPLELVSCNTQFNPDLSQACAQEMVAAEVTAVVGGIDVWGTGITTLENNGIPFVGGIPVSFEAARSPVSFQFSGGVWGAVLGEGQYAIEQHDAKRIAVIHADFGPITDAARLGEQVLGDHGVDVTLVAVAPINADMVQALNTAVAAKPDAIIALTADSGCKPTMLTAKQLGLDVPLMYTGACAAPAIIDSVGEAAQGAIFNLEAELGPEHPDNVIYQEIVHKYGPRHGYEWQSAGTVSFRAVINLYAALREIGAERLSRKAVLEQFRGAKNAPSFFGHPYTCDGKQLRGYPALCSPQQALGQLRGTKLAAVTGWLDVGAFAG